MAAGNASLAPSIAPLPRGRHGIARELVAANQRERLLCAATEIFAEQGYASLAVRGMIERARVSRATFYELFDDKVNCVLAAQRRAFEALKEAVTPTCGAGPHWPAGVAAAVGAALDFATSRPADARLLLASSHALSEPRLAREGLALQEELVAILHAGAERCPSARSPSPLAERAAVGAALSIVAGCFAGEEPGLLPDLKPKVAQIILTPYVGANEAGRIALAGN